MHEKVVYICVIFIYNKRMFLIYFYISVSVPTCDPHHSIDHIVQILTLDDKNIVFLILGLFVGRNTTLVGTLQRTYLILALEFDTQDPRNSKSNTYSLSCSR